MASTAPRRGEQHTEPIPDVAAPEPAAPELGPPAAKPTVHALGHSTPANLLGLAHNVGNAAFGRMVMRAPPSASSAGAEAATVPDGPLAQLRDELDDTFVDEDACLRYIGQLGPGERVLVGRDATMRQEMIDAFNVGEMLRAVELLALPVKLQMDWIRHAGDLDGIGNAAFIRLLNAATAADFGELIGWDDVRNAVQSAWSGDPLALAPFTTATPAQQTAWLGTGFATWAFQRDGAARTATLVAAADTAARIAALKTAGVWNDLLTGLRGEQGSGPGRDALHPIFTAATDPEDRRRLYEARFDTRAAGPVDWVANGEATWTTQETVAGTGQTQAQVEAAIAAGGPGTAEAAATADSGGPLAQLRDELDDVFVDEDKCLRLMGQLTDRENYLVSRDSAMLEQMGSAFNGAEMTRAIGLLRYLALKDGLAFASRSGEAGKISPALYELMLNRATSQQVAEAIGWDLSLQAMRAGHLDPLALGPLAGDAAMFQHVLGTYAGYADWCAGDGHASRLIRFMAANGPAPSMAALITVARLDAVIDALPTGAQLAPADQLALKTLFLASTDVPKKKLMLMKRFNIDSMGTEGGAPEFESAALDQIWVLLERLPPGQVADNEWFESINRKVASGATAPDGLTGSNRVALGYNVAGLGAPETGAFTDPGDQMRGTNMFDSNLIHEMGHAADAQFHFTRDGGPFDTEADLGAWQSHSDTDGLVTDWAATLNLSTAVPNADDRNGIIDALQWDMDHPTQSGGNAQAGFQAQAGAAWGTAGDPWQPRWNLVSGHALTNQVSMAQGSQSPWMTPPPAIGTRIYHDTGYNYWASYLAATRAGGKLSRYQFRDKRDFFAETYATFYLTPADPGQLVRAWNSRVYDWFVANVDRGFSTQATP